MNATSQSQPSRLGHLPGEGNAYSWQAVGSRKKATDAAVEGKPTSRRHLTTIRHGLDTEETNECLYGQVWGLLDELCWLRWWTQPPCWRRTAPVMTTSTIQKSHNVPWESGAQIVIAVLCCRLAVSPLTLYHQLDIYSPQTYTFFVGQLFGHLLKILRLTVTALRKSSYNVKIK